MKERELPIEYSEEEVMGAVKESRQAHIDEISRLNKESLQIENKIMKHTKAIEGLDNFVYESVKAKLNNEIRYFIDERTGKMSFETVRLPDEEKGNYLQE